MIRRLRSGQALSLFPAEAPRTCEKTRTNSDHHPRRGLGNDGIHSIRGWNLYPEIEIVIIGINSIRHPLIGHHIIG